MVLSALVGLGMLASVARWQIGLWPCQSAWIWRYTLPSTECSLLFVLLIITSSVLDMRMNDIKLEGEDVLEDVRTCGRGLDGHKSAEQVCRFCQGLIEEAEVGKGRELEGPELCEMEEKERRCK